MEANSADETIVRMETKDEGLNVANSRDESDTASTRQSDGRQRLACKHVGSFIKTGFATFYNNYFFLRVSLRWDLTATIG